MKLSHWTPILILCACGGAKPGVDVTVPEPATLSTTGLRPDAPAYALHGPYWVGFRRFEKVAAWYPALNPDRKPEEIAYTFAPQFAGLPREPAPVVYGHALADARLDDSHAPRPVIGFSHGYALNPEWYSTLLEHYASYGFVVLAPQHVESDWLQAWAALFDRPSDLRRTLDLAEALNAPGGPFEGQLDLSRIAVVGHSYGGYTALALAGARVDLAPFNARCAALDPSDPRGFICAPFLGKENEMATKADLAAPPQGLWPSLDDARVKAIVPLAGDAYLFNEAGLAPITVPMMAIGGTADRGTPWEWGSKLAFDHVGSARKSLVGFENAGHMIATNPCTAIPSTAALDPALRDLVCLEPVWDKLRTLDLINHFSTAFLLDVLAGDAAARKALSLDSARFTGIAYSAVP